MTSSLLFDKILNRLRGLYGSPRLKKRENRVWYLVKKVSFLSRAAALVLAAALLLSFPALADGSGEPPAIPDLTARAAVVLDFDTGEVLYGKDPDEPLVPASMVKVMTAYIVYEELARGSFTMDTEVPISNHVAAISRDHTNYEMVVPLPYGGTVPVGTLLRLMLIYSASASAVALAELVSGSEEAFVVRMNETAARLGLTASYVNPHGHLFNYITARSQAMLVRQFIADYPEVLEITSQQSVTFNGQDYPTTNYLLPGGRYSYEGTDGFKTGNTNPAGYCQTATAVRGGKRLIAVAMASSSYDTRATDCVKLLDYGFELLRFMGKYGDIAYHWCRPAVDTLDSMGVELHAGEGAYRPEALVTRAEFTAMLYSGLACMGALPEKVTDPDTPCPFDDIEGSWAEEYIVQAWERGIVLGSGTGFNPDAPITRQEIMVIIDRSVRLPDGNGLRFTDTGDIAFWALQAAARVTYSGIFTGAGGSLSPNGSATRAEAAQIVLRVVNLL